MKPTNKEIEDQIQLAIEFETMGIAKFPGMTYEQGVRYTIEWMLGESDRSPMED